MGVGGLLSSVSAGWRPLSRVTVPPRLDAPMGESGGTTSADARVVQFKLEARGRTMRWGQSARSRLSHANVPPGEALAVARALLRHPPLRAEVGTPEERWLDELAKLVRRPVLGSKVQNSCTTEGEPSAQPQRSTASTGRT